MNVIAVDDEPCALEGLGKKLSSIDAVEDVRLFSSGADACTCMESHEVDVALLDINLPGEDGFELARRMRALQPACAIVFVTGYSEYAVDAFKLHADGYVLKPMSVEDLKRELAYAAETKQSRLSRAKPRLHVQMFGGFEVFSGGVPVHFPRSKSKELFAFLVDRRGAGATNAQIASALWEDVYYDRSHQKMLQTIIADMLKALRAVGAADVIVRRRNHLSVDSEKLDCDYYRFIEGNPTISCLTTYLPDYSWAENTAAMLARQW
ncbi:response regulator [Raoultibacter phocaeensis]|uniref:response regulator n=1 Tax=Raoultibacter phocaeensis TaxID=2479841 RepID=UPI00111B345D|nr:response regulator [Raoultibacter phocaeensis]